ncbi:hypothetical protein [Vitiosangium sp. GDMCC 1.1324]|uniref:hypothetical protein n=1 Tax=Vitiosangium sp. (strain GDMCC 1.1324) TaxID=2138576 RepID=UPI000D36391F|nr:hypothetical protein [Vitiosangium sp. GDMCC 1.1324]PTL76852.1 hypothetical protein DAT35_47100 [Vitiosangium sp. GDMCC 1.1324]
MNHFDAIRFDREGQIEAAARLYEGSLLVGERTLELFLNLAILYWQATEIGFSTRHGLGPGFVATASERFPVLLSEAGRAYPESTEVRFWQKYIPWADLGEEIAPEDCRQFLKEDPAVLAPAMYLFAQTQGREYRQEAVELLRRCREDGTTRTQYVASVIEGVLKRSAWSEVHAQGGTT